MIEAIKDFPLYNDEKVLVNYKVGDFVAVRDQKLIDKLILSGKCSLHDPRQKEEPAESKVLDDYEKKIEPPAKKKRKRK